MQILQNIVMYHRENKEAYGLRGSCESDVKLILLDISQW